SGFERAFALLRAGAAPETVVSRDPSATDYDFLWRLNSVVDGIDLFFLGNDYDNASASSPVWQYVKTSSGEIIGRFAYAVQSDLGKLDPSVHLTNYMGAFSGALPDALSRFGTSEWELDFRNALKTSPATLSSQHFGRVTQSLYTASSAPTPHFGNPARYQDLLALITTANGDSGTAVTTAGEADLNKHLEFVQAPAPEAFWIDRNNDRKMDTEEYFHRFNLARIDWDNSYFDDVNLLFGWKKEDDGVTYTELADKDGAKYEFSARPYKENLAEYKAGTSLPAGRPGDSNMCLDTGGIQWLGKWTDNPSSLPGAWDNDLRRKQVAANIIQYCRKDTSPTVTNLPISTTDWVAAGAEPLYAGVGKHPLINEAAVKASVVGTVAETAVPEAPSTYNWKYDVTLSFGTELADIYNITPKRRSEVYFFGTFSCEYYDLTAGEYKALSLEISGTNGKVTLDPAGSPAPWGGNGYTTKASFWQSAALSAALPEGTFTGEAGKENDHKANLKLRNVKLVIDKIYLKYADSAGTLRDRDFSKVGKTFNVPNEESKDHVAVSEQKYFYGAAAAEDPRVNHYPDDWKPVYEAPSPAGSTVGENTVHAVESVALATDAFAGTEVKTTLGDCNLPVFGPLPAFDGDTADKESASDPALGTLSTAFIAENPMLSLWELGAVSRAEKWRTINLKKTVPHSASVTNMSGGKDTVMTFGDAGFQAGDGNILDQVKINEVVASPSTHIDEFKIERTAAFGKVNVNSSVHNVLRAVFKGVKFNTTLNRHYRYDRSSSDPGSDFYTLSCTGRNPADTADQLDPANCVACAVKGQENPSGTKLQYRTRADLLLPGNTPILDRFRISGSAVGANDAEQEQIAGKVMNLLKAEKLDQAYVIVVAQTVKEARNANGQTMYVDWNRNGDNSDTVSTSSVGDVLLTAARDGGTDVMAVKNAGYLRTPMVSELVSKRGLYGVRFGPSKSLQETVTKTAGTYCNGVDRITATVKLIVLLEKDSSSGKWKIRRYEYVD
ncbi:MAG: hypothetical protein J6331_04800, partial [Lentisphaeria bacterium]|nr:hypothetical protein [Lentisphaeria bacterium]